MGLGRPSFDSSAHIPVCTSAVADCGRGSFWFERTFGSPAEGLGPTLRTSMNGSWEEFLNASESAVLLLSPALWYLSLEVVRISLVSPPRESTSSRRALVPWCRVCPASTARPVTCERLESGESSPSWRLSTFCESRSALCSSWRAFNFIMIDAGLLVGDRANAALGNVGCLMPETSEQVGESDGVDTQEIGVRAKRSIGLPATGDAPRSASIFIGAPTAS
mmetsp:Transcript_142991/g.249542  ORF Transcript_142991/g.249542 Transcript_142991/m.249542 type:complete len:221 (-) Transcript_142991:2067-2729(-)